jgi:membrane-bound lytic murein transglycosylase D
MIKSNVVLKTFLVLMIFIAFTCSFISPALSIALANNLLPVFENYPIPQKLNLCGEPIPLEDQYVREMLDREFTISVWDQAQVFMWLKRAGRYFPYMEIELAKAGLPRDLKYLAVAESSLIPHIRSKAGAIGIWQFMPATGERFGLQNTNALDERRQFEQATKAAINLLTKLYQQFGSWSLAMAAYNCGESCVENAIREQKVNNYYRLSLPRETERFVFRIAAIKIILESPESFGYHLSPEQVYQPVTADMVKVYLQYPLHITDVAQELETDFKMIRDLNPHIIGNYLPSGTYAIHVPQGKGQKLYTVIGKLSKIAAEKTGEIDKYYIVVSGDNLSIISRKTGVSVSQLKSLNGIKGDVVHPGQRLRIR